MATPKAKFKTNCTTINSVQIIMIFLKPKRLEFIQPQMNVQIPQVMIPMIP